MDILYLSHSSYLVILFTAFLQPMQTKKKKEKKKNRGHQMDSNSPLKYNTIQCVENSEGDKKSLNVINITQHTATVLSGAQAQASLTVGQCARG